MRKLSLSLLTLSLGVALLPLAQAATTPAGSICWSRSASARPAIVKTVRQSLYRLELIDPNNPELIAARMHICCVRGCRRGAKSWND